jgi:RNA ligase (TIGR02306 family)
MTNQEIKYLEPALCEVLSVTTHPNADRLEVVKIKGFQVIASAGLVKRGSEVLYFEPETAFYEDQARRLGIDKYLHKQTDIRGNEVMVLNEVKLRGLISEGLILWPQAIEGIPFLAFKFQPPARTKFQVENLMPEVEGFEPYGSIQNLRQAPDAIASSTLVQVTEKIHGTNSRVGFTKDSSGKTVLHAGSRTTNRKNGSSPEALLYWSPYDLYPGIEKLLNHLRSTTFKSAVLYGEIYGSKIQSYNYGLKPGEVDYRAFTLKVEGSVVPAETFRKLAAKFDVPTVPVIGENIPYSYEAMKALADGPSLLGANASHGREGIVIQHGPDIYKLVSDSYLLGKGSKLNTTDL